jgi:Tfp pilus assembly protein PilO
MINLSELKNIDLGNVFRSLASNRTSLIKGPYAKVILWSALGGILFFAYIYFIFWPNLEQRQQMQRKVDAIPEMESKLRYLDVANQKAEDDLRQSEKSYAELNQLFSVESELEELYQRLSMMASSQGLVISSLTKEGEEAIYAGNKQGPANSGNPAAAPAPMPAPNPADPNAKPVAQGAPLFYRIKLKVELTGQYGRYMRYRKLLSEFDKSINIDKDVITLVPGDSRGAVVVKSQLSTYRLPNKLPTKPGASNFPQVVPPSTLQPVNYFPNMGMRFIKVAAEADPLAASSAPRGRTIAGANTVTNDEMSTSASPGADTRGSNSQERDPFARSSSGMIEGGRDPRISPLVMASPQSYVITGVIVSNSVKAAMVRTDFRENFVVKIGDRLGNQGGVIVDIDMDGIVIKQANGKIRIYLQSQSGQPMATSNGGMAR